MPKEQYLNNNYFMLYSRNEIKKILKTVNYYETSKKVFLKHGSRKRNTTRINKKSKQLSLF